MTEAKAKGALRQRVEYFWLRWSGRVALLFFSSFCFLCFGLQSLLMFASGPGIFVLAGLLATLFTVPNVLLLVWLDRNEQEPVYLMLTAFLWGAIVATAISGIFNSVMGEVALGVVGDYYIASQLTASFSAPFIEELTKGIAVFFIYLLFRDDFDNVLDGVLYGALIGLGFAWFENIAYYVGVGLDGGVGEMVKLTYVRGLLNGVGSHAAYTGLTGLGFGLVRVWRQGVLRFFVVPFFWGLAMLSHFMWNTFAGLFTIPAGSEAAVMFVSLPLAVFFLEFPFVLLLFLVIVFVWRQERRLIEKYLADEPADVVMDGDVDSLVPARRRFFRQLLRFFTGGPVQWWHMRQLAHEQVRLAFMKWHHDKDAETSWDPDSDRDIVAWRERVRARQSQITRRA